MHAQHRPPRHTLSESQMAGIRRALASIDADIDTARSRRATETGDSATRRLATRRTDMPWWMKRAG